MYSENWDTKTAEDQYLRIEEYKKLVVSVLPEPEKFDRNWHKKQLTRVLQMAAQELPEGEEGPLLDFCEEHCAWSKSHRWEYGRIFSRYRKSVPILQKKEDVVIEFDDETEAEPHPQTLLAPGLVGKIAAWITSTAIKPQPALSLGAALVAVGVLKGHRVQSETGLRTNLFILGIGHAGCGKEHPLKCIRRLFEESGNSLLLLGKPKSDSGLYKAMAHSRGRGLLLWDELGRSLAEINKRNAATHTVKILELLLELFSRAGDLFIGEQAALTERVDIDQPCLGIYGTTVPGRFYDSLNNSFVKDGFLPRWLPVFVDNPDVEEQDGLVGDVPLELVEAVLKIVEQPTNSEQKGNLDTVIKVRPRVLKFSEEAREALKGHKKFFNEQKKLARGRSSELEDLWNRGLEHTVKVSLVVEDGDEVSAESLAWAFEFVKGSLTLSARAFSENSAESEFERKLKKVKKIIEQAGPEGISGTLLCRKLQSLTKFERDQIFTSLLEMGELSIDIDRRVTKSSKVFKLTNKKQKK